jgi:AcrR family transcriptional regulator
MSTHDGRKITGMPEPGRRERKKAQTRALIAETAARLFLERGFDAVTVKDVADAADVSPTTVFTHFPRKEDLVFDEYPQQEAELVTAIHDREPGASVLAALEEHLSSGRLFHDERDPEFQAFVEMVDATPALRDYERGLLRQQESALTRALLESTEPPVEEDTAKVVARFVMSAIDLARDDRDPAAVLSAAFAVLRAGWPGS